MRIAWCLIHPVLFLKSIERVLFKEEKDFRVNSILLHLSVLTASSYKTSWKIYIVRLLYLWRLTFLIHGYSVIIIRVTSPSGHHGNSFRTSCPHMYGPHHVRQRWVLKCMSHLSYDWLPDAMATECRILIKYFGEFDGFPCSISPFWRTKTYIFPLYFHGTPILQFIERRKLSFWIVERHFVSLSYVTRGLENLKHITTFVWISQFSLLYLLLFKIAPV
jgi:hypothetical protein